MGNGLARTRKKKKLIINAPLDNRKIIIWSVGVQFRIMFSQYELADIEPYIECFIDSSVEKQGKVCRGKLIRSPNEIKDWSEYFVIVTSEDYWIEISDCLQSYGLKEDKDFVYWRKLVPDVILGISGLYHDSAAAIVVNGSIAAAAQEERFTRVKQDLRFPENAINYCLKEVSLEYIDVDAVIYYDNPLLTLDRFCKNVLWQKADARELMERSAESILGEKLWIHKVLEDFSGGIWKNKVYVCKHHISHAASAFYPSPFKEAVIVTFDGVGEWATTTIGVGKGQDIKLLYKMDYPDSIGLLYSAFTYFCGFKVNSGEYKLMGLAPYGQPIYYEIIKEQLVTIYDDGSFKLNLDYFSYYKENRMTNENFARLFGGEPRKAETTITQREMDLAASIQKVVEEIVLKTVSYAQKLTGMENLCLAGGVALNCVANGKILKCGLYKHIWVQPAAGDAGSALGAALYGYYRLCGKERRIKESDSMGGSYLGPRYLDTDIREWLNKYQIPGKEYDRNQNDFYDRIGKLLEEGKVIGIFQGRMEFGPRALGHRSIIADSRNSEMQSKLNLKIKFRESFRPFAPSVLLEDSQKYFKLNGESPYMLFVSEVNSEICTVPEGESKSEDLIEIVKQRRSEIPAVTHVDYSARIQTVTKERSPEFYRIIKAFKDRTGCGCIINTSFNVRGEPIVCTLKDAYACFMRTDMDVLVLENFILLKEEQPDWKEQEDWKKIYELD